MIYLKKFLLTSILLFVVTSISVAQATHKAGVITDSSITTTNQTSEYFFYDSLGNHYLFLNDTSMAIYYYQKAVETDTSKTDALNSLKKLRRCYNRVSQSFYLKEY